MCNFGYLPGRCMLGINKGEQELMIMSVHLCCFNFFKNCLIFEFSHTQGISQSSQQQLVNITLLQTNKQKNPPFSLQIKNIFSYKHLKMCITAFTCIHIFVILFFFFFFPLMILSNKDSLSCFYYHHLAFEVRAE